MQGILRFVSMLFNVMGVIEIFRVCKYPFLIFQYREVIEVFGICKYPFLT